MQLDKTRIAIRERELLDTFDLSLRVVRRYIAPLIITFSLGAVPLMIINHLLLGWLMDVEYRDAWFYVEETTAIGRYVWGMILLVAIEAPLASIFMTSYLGRAVFVDRPDILDIVRDVLRMFPRVAWCQLLIRGILPALLLALTYDRYEFRAGTEVLLMGGLTLYALMLRFVRPFINEIVLLERNPLISRDAGAITVGSRSWQLHGPSSGDLLARSMGTMAFAVLLTAVVMGTFVFVSGVFFNDWKPGPTMICYFFPLSMWIVVGFVSVVRFLSYLDLRIRHEGWEVELRMRAEAVRLASQMA
jgi:hypothetical protein